tara:strand:+ start:541 stop:909 length:369 start_codon:yes stop_codon:yes gene_type:complete
MIISEQEKNRIRGLHKAHSIIKEQETAVGKSSDENWKDLVNCAIENIGEDEMTDFAESLSDECVNAIVSLFQNGKDEITVADLSGGVACLRDAATNPQTFSLIADNWRPMTECMMNKNQGMS